MSERLFLGSFRKNAVFPNVLELLMEQYFPWVTNQHYAERNIGIEKVVTHCIALSFVMTRWEF